MLNELPLFYSIAFLVTTLLTLILFYYATNKSKEVLIVITLLMTIQSVLSYNGFYLNTKTVPPRFLLIMLPTLLIILGLFISKKGKAWLQTLDLKMLTLLSVVRIPVELILYILFIYKTIPELMTFSGRNFDILPGLVVPIIYYLKFVKKQSNKIFMTWNVIGLVLIVNIIVQAVLSAPFIFQQFAFDQPNVGVLYFPFILLPVFVAPAVLFSHLVMLFRRGE